MKASEVLQKCINDIDAGKWVCGKLHSKSIEGKHANPKEMGCAVGLVSLNSGDTIKMRITKQDLPFSYKEEKITNYPIERDEAGGSCFLYNSEGIKVGQIYEVARYPKNNSPQETLDSIDYLNKSIPDSPEGISLAGKTENVVKYNDGDISGKPQAAKEWFKDALSIALAEGN